MIPKRIELENFLSFGKPAVAFTFTDDEPLWALCGKNGVGKSAVFDGITYALYGEHRGGTQKAEQLIRHGANGFRIVLEFEFAGVEYRITRVRAGRTAQKVERRIDGEWEAVPGVNSAADVKAWVEKTLGLGYKAFTSSALLRQGEADKLFSASRDERIAVLKGIIGFERFEEVSGRVHAATLSRGNTLDTLRRQLGALVAVTPEELAAAEAAVTTEEQKRAEAQTAPADLAERLARAEADEKATGETKQAASGELAAAAALLKQAQDRRDRFADVAVGVTCSQCGQLVDEAHAAKERARLADADGLRALVAELDRLQSSGVAARFDLLRQDDEKRAEWSEQLQTVRAEIDRIPAEARIPVTEAERRQAEAKALWDAANAARDTAVRTRDGLQSRAEQHQGLTAQLRTAEREHDLHKKLDNLLGQNELQRELVRDAEQQIVGLANDTLQHLSDGDLSVEQDDEAAGRDDKAFALRVRRAGDPLPIGVLFLSGSQKFRVAVSVALAVGRFASGRARPLEAVIIDEGFGSLDKDGLRATA